MLATPVPTHAALAERVLRAGKHCFVEKPLAQSVADAERAVAAAAESGRMLMVGHLLEYHPGVAKLKEIADSGELGEIHYIYSNRLNLGKLRADENALWSLGAHDVSVVLHLADEEPYELDARGESYMQPGIEDVVFGYLRFPSGRAAHLHLSWLDPHKERRFTVVGSKRMATFDDMDIERKVTVYDKGFDEDSSSYGEYITRAGDIWSPRDPQPRAAADRVRALRRVHPRGPHAALGRRQRAARGARARGAAGAARRQPEGAGCSHLTARPGCCSASTCSWPTTSSSAPRRHPRRHGRRRGLRDPGPRRARQAAEARRALERAARGRRRRSCSRPGAVVCAGAIVFAGRCARRGRDRRRPGVRPRARGDRARQRRRARHARSTTTC